MSYYTVVQYHLEFGKHTLGEGRDLSFSLCATQSKVYSSRTYKLLALPPDTAIAPRYRPDSTDTSGARARYTTAVSDLQWLTSSCCLLTSSISLRMTSLSLCTAPSSMRLFIKMSLKISSPRPRSSLNTFA